MSEKKISKITVRVPEELYTEYKIALLKRYPRQNVTQHLMSVMRQVVAETNELNGKEG